MDELTEIMQELQKIKQENIELLTEVLKDSDNISQTHGQDLPTIAKDNSISEVGLNSSEVKKSNIVNIEVPRDEDRENNSVDNKVVKIEDNKKHVFENRREDFEEKFHVILSKLVNIEKKQLVFEKQITDVLVLQEKKLEELIDKVNKTNKIYSKIIGSILNTTIAVGKELKEIKEEFKELRDFLQHVDSEIKEQKQKLFNLEQKLQINRSNDIEKVKEEICELKNKLELIEKKMNNIEDSIKKSSVGCIKEMKSFLEFQKELMKKEADLKKLEDLENKIVLLLEEINQIKKSTL